MNTPTVVREAFFLAAPSGGRFCILSRPVRNPRGAVLLVPPFAEELNKSRRMVALAASAFAREGWLVMQPDLLGCGDSGGDFGDATWSSWLDDVDRAVCWLRQEAAGPLVLWSLRAGSLLAWAWAQSTGGALPLLAWQPVLNGKQHLQQFLRLRGVSEMLHDSAAKEAMVRLRDEMAAGKSVEIAGYVLAPAMVSGLERATLDPECGYRAPVRILELAGGVLPECSLATRRWVDRAVAHGCEVTAAAMQGAAFWQTQEIAVCPELIESSCAALAEFSHVD